MKRTVLAAALPLLLVACGGSPAPELKLPPEVAAKCSELSGLSGPVEDVPSMGVTYVWSDDGMAVAECEGKTIDEVKLIHILK